MRRKPQPELKSIECQAEWVVLRAKSKEQRAANGHTKVSADVCVYLQNKYCAFVMNPNISETHFIDIQAVDACNLLYNDILIYSHIYIYNTYLHSYRF